MTSPILYVEDEEDYQLLVKRILSRAGLEVVVADTGAEGMKALGRERPSLLILDINLPDTDGYTICQSLRRDPAWQDLPILMLTVRRRPEEWLRGFSSGANDYVSKPLNPPELVERVVRCLEAKARTEKDSESAEYRLIQAAVGGNRSAFEVLIEKYSARLTECVRSTVRRDAPIDDIVAESFAIAYENLKNFRGEASFYTWLYRIALNEAIDAGRRPGWHVSLEDLKQGEDSPFLTNNSPGDSPEHITAEAEMKESVLAALGQVPELYREVLEMYFLKELSYHAIAKQLRIPEGTVMSRLHKARRLLQEIWQNKPLCFAGSSNSGS